MAFRCRTFEASKHTASLLPIWRWSPLTARRCASGLSRAGHSYAPPPARKRGQGQQRVTKGSRSDAEALASSLSLKTLMVTDRFRRYLTADDLESAMDLYPSIDLSALEPTDVSILLRLLHYCQRDSRTRATLTENRLGQYAKVIIEDIKLRKLVPNPVASLFLLAFFRDRRHYEPGKQIWEWLKSQGEGYVDARSYGAAIELLAHSGESLQNLEDLYEEALAVDPGQFNGYHLSPGAIVTDKSQYASLSGIRLSLLQGILTARVLRGDWRNAYLALDTAIRLGLDLVPRRFFEQLIYGRPVSEGLKVFLLACQSGIRLAPNVLTVLLSALAKCQSVRSRASANICLATAGITAVHAFAGAGGVLDTTHLARTTSLLFGSLHVLPLKPLDVLENRSLPNNLLDYIRFATDMFQQRGVQIPQSLYREIISRASRLLRGDVVHMAASKLYASSPNLDRATIKSLLRAGGDLADLEVIKLGWEAITASKDTLHRQTESHLVDLNLWKELVLACRKSDQMKYLDLQITQHEHLLSQDLIESIRKEMSLPQTQSRRQPQTNTDTRIDTYVETSVVQLLQKMKMLQNLMASSELHNFYLSPMTTDVLWTTVSLPSIPSRSLYEQLTTDKHQNFASGEGTRKRNLETSTGYPLAELRFHSWKTINELLIEAETNEQTRTAASQGTPCEDVSTLHLMFPPNSQSIADELYLRDMESQGVSKERREWSDNDLQTAILRLRGLETSVSSEPD